MATWEGSYRRGQRLLSRHKAVRAAGEFSKALELCPAERSENRARIFYYLGLALSRSGDVSRAVQSWQAVHSLVRTGPVAASCSHWINGYGMRRRGSAEDDDWEAFRDIHVRRYLCKRGHGRFCTDCERDAVNDLIRDAFLRLVRSGLLSSLSDREKLSLFRRSRVSLPFLYLDDALENYQGTDIQIDINWVSLTRKNSAPLH